MVEIDLVAKEEASRKWVMPESLHLPVAARDRESIVKYIGETVRELSAPNTGGAFMVRVTEPKAINKKLAVWKLPQSAVLHKTMQVWVHVDYRAYRRAYVKGFPNENISKMVLDHIWNRRMAKVMGYQFVRIVPISRGANSSSGSLAEQWSLDYQSTPEMRRRNLEKNQSIQYADLHSLVKMLDINTGGGVMDAVNEAQSLLLEA